MISLRFSRCFACLGDEIRAIDAPAPTSNPLDVMERISWRTDIRSACPIEMLRPHSKKPF